MNSVEQKTHRTVTADIVKTLEEVAEAAAQRMQALEDGSRTLATLFQGLVGEERTHRLRMAEEQRSYVDDRDREIKQAAYIAHGAWRAFVGRGFWSRLNWLLTGR